jgi:hypothetical protein
MRYDEVVANKPLHVELYKEPNFNYQLLTMPRKSVSLFLRSNPPS